MKRGRGEKRRSRKGRGGQETRVAGQGRMGHGNKIYKIS